MLCEAAYGVRKSDGVDCGVSSPFDGCDSSFADETTHQVTPLVVRGSGRRLLCADAYDQVHV